MKPKKGDTIVVWFSCGAASAVAAKKTIELYGDLCNILIVNNPIKEEDKDNIRFKADVSKWLGKIIIEAGNKDYPSNSAVEVWEKKKFMSSPKGAPCTVALKKGARYQFESENKIDWHVMGFTVDEKHRHENFTKTERANVLPVLIECGLTKSDCFIIIESEEIELPLVYRQGFPNANCIGCVKATSPTYWNHVRNTRPEVFKERAEQSRRIGARLVRYKGKRIFLDELPAMATGRKLKTYECSIWCNVG